MKSIAILATAFVLAIPAALAGPAVDARSNASDAKSVQSNGGLCAMRCRHEVQGRAALNYIATPRPAARD